MDFTTSLALLIFLFTQTIFADTEHNSVIIDSNQNNINHTIIAANTSTKQIPQSTIKQSTDFIKNKVYVKPTLEVLQLGKEFEKWESELTITSPQIAKFRFGSMPSDSSIAMWQVSRDTKFINIIASGPIKPIPEQGKVTHFTINFADIVSISPQNAGLKPTNYYVRVATYKTLRQHLHLTDTLNIVLKKPSREITKFTKIDPIAPPAKLKIEFKSFQCIEESSDGPGSDEPFLVVLKADPLWKDFRAYATRVFQNVDDDEIRKQNIVIYDYSRYRKDPKYGYSEPYWSKDDPSEIIFLVGMAECDNWSWSPDTGDVWNSKTGLHMGNYGIHYANSAGFSTKQNGPYQNRDIASKTGFVTLNKWLNGYNHESLGIRELRFTKQEIDYARKNPGKPVPKQLTFKGDDSHYVATFYLTGIPESIK